MATISNLAIDQYSDFTTSVTINAGAADTLLNGALTNSATTITVNSTTEFPNNGKLTLSGQEIVTYTGKTATTFTGVTRGTNSTTAIAHSDNATVVMTEAALDLTSYTVNAQIRKNYSSSTATTFGTTITSATDGIIELTLTDVVTGALEEGRYVWDLVITGGDTKKKRIVEGIATVRPGVAR